MKELRIVLADDHALVRAGIRALLDNLGGVKVVGEAGNGLETLKIIGETSPDIALIDIAMPELNGLAAAERAGRLFPSVKVIILSMHRGQEFVIQALRAGAVGFLVKDAAESELEVAIHSVARGESYLSPAVSKGVIASSIGWTGEYSKTAVDLTPRQREVLRLVVQGRTTKEIAHALGISAKTVEVHRAQLTDRLGIHDVPGLVRYAMRTGLITPEPYQGA
jgi:DNA-binding NarL/FixJ family response regulator